MSGTRYNQFCALARAAEIVGERWTLLIIRELLLAPMRFGDLRARLGDASPFQCPGLRTHRDRPGDPARDPRTDPLGRAVSLSDAERRNLRAGLGVARTRRYRAP